MYQFNARQYANFENYCSEEEEEEDVGTSNLDGYFTPQLNRLDKLSNSQQSNEKQEEEDKATIKTNNLDIFSKEQKSNEIDQTVVDEQRNEILKNFEERKPLIQSVKMLEFEETVPVSSNSIMVQEKSFTQDQDVDKITKEEEHQSEEPVVEKSVLAVMDTNTEDLQVKELMMHGKDESSNLPSNTMEQVHINVVEEKAEVKMVPNLQFDVEAQQENFLPNLKKAEIKIEKNKRPSLLPGARIPLSNTNGRISPSVNNQKNGYISSPNLNNGRVSPSLNNNNNGRTSPSMNQTNGRVSPSMNQTFGRVSPSIQQNNGRVSPSIQQSNGRVSPSIQQNNGRVSPSFQQNNGRVSPAFKPVGPRVSLEARSSFVPIPPKSQHQQPPRRLSIVPARAPSPSLQMAKEIRNAVSSANDLLNQQQKGPSTTSKQFMMMEQETDGKPKEEIKFRGSGWPHIVRDPPKPKSFVPRVPVTASVQLQQESIVTQEIVVSDETIVSSTSQSENTFIPIDQVNSEETQEGEEIVPRDEISKQQQQQQQPPFRRILRNEDSMDETTPSFAPYRIKTSEEALGRGRLPGYLTPTESSISKNRVKASPRPASPSLPMSASKRLTEPRTPHLATSERKRSNSGQLVSSTTRELEQVALQRKMMVERRNREQVQLRQAFISKSVIVRPNTEPQPFSLRTEAKYPTHPVSNVFHSTAEIAAQVLSRDTKFAPPVVAMTSNAMGHQLIEPHSPQLLTESRSRGTTIKSSEEMEWERLQQEKLEIQKERERKEHRIQMILNSSTESKLLQQQQRSTIQLRPFELESLERHEKARKEFQMKIENEVEEEEKRRIFKARPIPTNHLTPYAGNSNVAPPPLTNPIAPSCVERALVTEEMRRRKLEKEEEENEKARQFRARPLPKTTYEPGFVAAPSDIPLVELAPPALHSDERAIQRMQWEEEKRQQEYRLEKQREQMEREKQVKEQVELRNYRKSLVHKPLAIPETSRFTNVYSDQEFSSAVPVEDPDNVYHHHHTPQNVMVVKGGTLLGGPNRVLNKQLVNV